MVEKYACGASRYILSKGRGGTRPIFQLLMLRHSADRCLFECVLFNLDGNVRSSGFRHSHEISCLAEALRSRVKRPFSSLPEYRFLPVSDVTSLRKELNAHSSSTSANVTMRTIESRSSPVLAARNVHLYSLSRKNRCYATAEALVLVHTVNEVISLAGGDKTALLPRERRRLLNEMSRVLASKRDDYRRGRWKLSEEISAVPRKL